MKADNRGMVLALRRAVKDRQRGIVDYLTDEIVRHLDLLDDVPCASCGVRYLDHHTDSASHDWQATARSAV